MERRREREEEREEGREKGREEESAHSHHPSQLPHHHPPGR